jgi:hypothetical protein
MAAFIIACLFVFGLYSKLAAKKVEVPAPMLTPAPPVSKPQSSRPGKPSPTAPAAEVSVRNAFRYVPGESNQRQVIQSFVLNGVEVRPGDAVFVTDMLRSSEFSIAVERNEKEIVSGLLSRTVIEERTR